MNANINRRTKFVNLGLKDFKESWDYQADLFNAILSVKSANRNLPPEQQQATDNYLLFVEHPHVYTLGKNGDAANLLINEQDLKAAQATYYHINRGGDITYHGPGQIVGYPVIDLENFFTDIHKYMRLMEESVILTLKEFGIEAGRVSGLAGVWVEPENESRARKICAVGVKMSRWVTMHGFALNVNTDMRYFDRIVPCGITNKTVTSMERELGNKQDMDHVSIVLKEKFARVFEMELL